MGYLKDLDTGKQGERLARQLLSNLGYKTEDGDGRHVDFYLLGNSKLSCECKYDLYANKSHRFAIEIKNSKTNTDSGITSTKCDLWFHVLSHNEIYVAKIPMFKKQINKIIPFKVIDFAGDGNAKILLFNKDQLIESCFLKLTHSSIKQIIK